MRTIRARRKNLLTFLVLVPLLIGVNDSDVDARAWARAGALVADSATEDRRLAVFFVQRAMIRVEAGDLAKAAADYESALATRAMLPEERQDALGNLGRIYLSTEQFRASAHALEAWLESEEGPDAPTVGLLAYAYLQLGEYDKAVAMGALAASVAGNRADDQGAVERLRRAFAARDLEDAFDSALRE